MGLRNIPLKISYRSKGEDNVLDSFIIPAFRESVVYKRSAGYFSSSVFEIIGEGVNEFISNGGKIQLICNPDLSREDIEAIKVGYQLKQVLSNNAFWIDVEETLKSLPDENLVLLARLIESDCLNIKVVDVDDEFGIYHDKVGIFVDSDDNRVLFVGSPNETKNAYKNNYEKIRLSMSWKGGDEEHIIDDEEEFDSIWNGTNPYLTRTDVTELMGNKVNSYLSQRGIKKNNINGGIVLRDYQIEAINAWLNNGNKGFYIMATGTGKTWTAIYTAKTVMDKENLLLVICAPYKHLIKQWKEDVHKVFPQNPIILVSSENSNWQEEFTNAILDSKYNESKSVIVISTIKSFGTEKFERIAKKCRMKRMLVVDEAHRFKDLSSETKRLYSYLLGLSATPSSKKNEEFGKNLVAYFGGEVYNLPIEYAISKGYLVNYYYHPIFVDATSEDEEKFDYYTKLMSSCFRNNVCIDLESLSKYKRARLRTIAMAQEKTFRIENILDRVEEKDHFIVYCGDGRMYSDDANEGIRHIQFIKNILSDKGFKVSQFTASEKMDERMRIVEAFNKGMIDTMVAIRCLDEGINIPSIEGALLLASNDDYREFVQRRGRILRTYHDHITNKEKQTANIYDVVVLPSDASEKFAAIELRRFYEYARLSINKDECKEILDSLLIRYGLEVNQLIDMEDYEEELDE